jgi:hypothetical protein
VIPESAGHWASLTIDHPLHPFTTLTVTDEELDTESDPLETFTYYDAANSTPLSGQYVLQNYRPVIGSGTVQVLVTLWG